MAQAHNGSGKTTCFVLAMLSRVDPKLAQPQALCVCPTRELVVQNLQVLERMGRHAGITATSTAAVDFQITRRAGSVLLGSAAANKLCSCVRESAGEFPRGATVSCVGRRQTRIIDQVVFGTHGSLKNWMSKRVLSVHSINILVFDEADEMLKARLPACHGPRACCLGRVCHVTLLALQVDAFASDSVRMIKDVRQATGNPDLQILLFSATFNDKVKNFAMKVVPGANQASGPHSDVCGCRCTSGCFADLTAYARWMQVFVPREELSLDVIKQYKVVSFQGTCLHSRRHLL